MTKADKLRMQRLHEMPCVCCMLNGRGALWPTEAHHLVDYGTREASGGHQATIPLCRWHHRAEPAFGRTKQEMLSIYGPSLKYQGGKFGFVNRWGTERDLLAITNKRIAA